jgi:hypothetical protein
MVIDWRRKQRGIVATTIVAAGVVLPWPSAPAAVAIESRVTTLPVEYAYALPGATRVTDVPVEYAFAEPGETRATQLVVEIVRRRREARFANAELTIGLTWVEITRPSEIA